MKIEKLPPIRTTLRASDHPYLTGAWTPLHEEVTAYDLPVLEGAVPKDIDGVYLRNTENQIHEPLGRYHPFDGDGMIHQIDIRNGEVSYRNRFVRTRCMLAEQEANGSLWGGLMDPPGTSRRPGFGAHGSLKDSSSTDIIVHAGVALSTFYQCGEAYCLDPETLDHLGVARWAPLDGVSAHAKVDPHTDELLFFNYSKHAPYMHYGVVDRHGKVINFTPIPLPGPRLPHDLAASAHYTILNDLPAFWDQELLERNIHAVRMHDQLPSRFGILPRHGKADQLRWFEAQPTYVLHFLNAFEAGHEIVMDGYFQENPTPRPHRDAPAGYRQMMAYLDEYSFRSRLHRWRFDMRTGKTHEEPLDDRILEFGMINQQLMGRPYRYGYSSRSKPGWFLFTGFVKHDLATGRSWEIELDENQYASEAPFAPRIGAKDEDDGYLVSFVTDENKGTSECILIDAKRFEEGPICRIGLPHKICSGTHAHWASRPFLRAASPEKLGANDCRTLSPG
jgi:carotenoid cleavage dioxygenase-like enzyme